MSADLKQFLQTAELPIEDDTPPLIYLASPYSHSDAEVMAKRLEQITAFTAAHLEQPNGGMVYAPVVYTAHLAPHCTPSQGWYYAGLQMLARCDRLVVVKMDGWEQSLGVQLEIAFALGRGIRVDYVDPEWLIDGTFSATETASTETETQGDLTEAEIARQMDEMLKWNEDQYGNMSETELRQHAIGILEDDIPF